MYSPEVYINLWKDLPMQAGANKLYTPLGLHEYEKYTPMFCTTGSPRVGRAIQDSKSNYSNCLFCRMAVHCQLEFYATLGIHEAEGSEIYLHVLQ